MNVLRWLYSYMQNDNKLIVLGVVATALAAISGVITPFIAGKALDIIIQNLETNSADSSQLIYFSFLIILITILTYILTTIGWYSTELMTARATQRLRSDIFITLQKQSHKYFDQNSTGNLLSKATSDTMALWDFFWSLPYLLTSALFKLASVVVLLFIIDFYLGLISLISLPIIFVASKRFSSSFYPINLKSRQVYGNLTKVMQENIDGIMVSKAFGAKNKEFTRFDNINTDYRNIMFKARKIQAAYTPQMLFLSGVITGITLLVGSFLVLNNQLPVGMLIASIMLTKYLSNPIDRLTDFIIIWGAGTSASKRLIDLLSSVPEIVDSSSAVKLPKDGKGSIEFKSVEFGYRTEPVLHEINLNIFGGKSIAILGETGSGKSSLVNLIPRFYDTTNGEVLIDNIDIKKIKLNSLRKEIGFVDQETFLFSRTVFENITFGLATATIEDAIHVAKLARIHEFIESLPKKYETVIGEKGVNLSGGQKQRISIARALLSNPKIVILDDSLSAVDAKTEREIKIAIEALLKDRTTIVITQRISSIASADFLIIMKNGRIIEQGKHEDLLKKDSIYKKLVETEKEGIIDLSYLN